MLDAGLGHIPEDRQRRGLVLEFTIAENIAAPRLRPSRRMARFGWLFPRRLIELRAAPDRRVRRPRRRRRRRSASALSGGNQQKVVAAREISRDPKVLIAAQPTARARRGRDRVPAPPARRGAATRGARSCSSRSSSTRSCRSPTGSSSSTRARSSASTATGRERGGDRARDARRPNARTPRERGAALLPPKPPEPDTPPTTVAARLDLAAAARAGSSVPVADRGRSRSAIGGLVVLATGHNPLVAYRDILNGAGLNWLFAPVGRRHRAHSAPTTSRQTLLQTTTLDPDGPRGRVRLPLRDVQHRRPGPVLHRALRRELDRDELRQHVTLPLTSCSDRARPTLAGAVWAAIAGFLKAAVGAHEVITTIMLNWIAYLDRELPLPAGRPAPGRREQAARHPDLGRHRAQCEAARVLGRPGAPGPAHRLLRRDRGARSSSGRSSTGRRSATRCGRSASTPTRPRTAGSSVRTNYDPRDGDLRGLRGSRGRPRHARLPLPRRDVGRPGLEHRVPRDRGRAARPQHRGRRRRSPRSSSARSSSGRRTGSSRT